MELALSYLSEQEKHVLNSFEKVIVWGFPLYSHTHSYIHACWVKTFQALGKKTYWFSNEQHESPETFSYTNSLIITEGFQDDRLPLHPSNTYFIHFCIYPQKYLRCGARIFEIRFHVPEFHDCNNDWKLDDGTHTLVNLSQDVLYESLTTNVGIAREFRSSTPARMNYEAVYMTWPTDLLPWEIDLKDAEKPRENAIHFVGTSYSNNRLEAFLQIAKEQGIGFVHHNPWDKPVSFEEGKEFVQRSIVAPDFRPIGTQDDKDTYGELNGKNHLAIGYIPCRLYKNISYGHIPLTDSPHAAEHFGDAVVYDKDLRRLLEKGLEAQKDIPRKHRAMKMIAERHTYLHRARDLLRAVLQPRPAPLHPQFLASTWSRVTIVSALIDINREGQDGRKFSTYVAWFRQFLQIPAPMILFVDPQVFELVKTLRANLPTKIICQHFNATPLSWSKPFLKKVQDSKEWKAYAKNPTDINNTSPPYVALMHSKFPWVWDGIQDNPFQSDLFFWMDGGLTRFYPEFPYKSIEPHPRTLRSLWKKKNICAQIGGYKGHYIQELNSGKRFTADELVGTNENILMGGFWGGHKETVQSLCEFGMRFFIQELIQKNRVESDQPTLFFHFQHAHRKYVLSAPVVGKDMPLFLYFLLGIIE